MPPVVQLILYACTIMSVGFRRRAAPLHPFFRPISPPLSLVIEEDRHSISGSARVRVRCTARSGGVLVHTELCGTHAHTVHTISVTPPLSRRATLGICPASPGAAQPPPSFPLARRGARARTSRIAGRFIMACTLSRRWRAFILSYMGTRPLQRVRISPGCTSPPACIRRPRGPAAPQPPRTRTCAARRRRGGGARLRATAPARRCARGRRCGGERRGRTRAGGRRARARS